MAREKRKPPGTGRRVVEWGVRARFADGSVAWHYVDQRFLDDTGRHPERWGRDSDARRYPSEDAARRAAAAMRLNSEAWAYEALPLPPPALGRARGDEGPPPEHRSPSQRFW